MNPIAAHPPESILQQGYKRNWDSYIRQLSSTRGPHWDLCILTASNPRQARAYELQIEHRRRAGLLPEATEFLVIADPEGRRIGSGGATLWALSAAARLAGGVAPNGNPFSGRRILLIHSGGDSRRLPHYSAIGKLFARVPHELPDGRCSTLFDEFLVSLCGLPPAMADGVVVVSGDVLLLFDQSQLDFARQGVVGVAMAAPPETATHHGVYVTEGPAGAVRQFLHKPPLDAMKRLGALNESGLASVDTGIVWLDPAFALSMFDALGASPGDDPAPESPYSRIVDGGVSVNFYGDILAPLAAEAEREAYLDDTSDGPATGELRQIRARVWETLRGAPFAAQTVRPARFIHFGSTAEYRDTLVNGPAIFAGLHWRHRVAAWPAPAAGASQPILLNSLAQGFDAARSGAAIVEDCRLDAATMAGDGAIVSHIDTGATPVTVEAGMVLYQTPVTLDDSGSSHSGIVTQLVGVDDNPKHPWTEPGATFLNRPFRQWMETAGVVEANLWDAVEPADTRTLWTARLFPMASSAAEGLRLALWMQRPEQSPPLTRDLWLNSDRLSLRDAARFADHSRMIERQNALEDGVRMRLFLQAVLDERWSRPAARLLGTEPAGIRRRAALARDTVATEWTPVERIRGFKALADALEQVSIVLPGCLAEAEAHEDRAFEQLAAVVRNSIDEAEHTAFRPTGFACAMARVRAAARLDFGGGWSDTPPYCIEKGGTVLNAAVLLNGAYPIVAEARRTGTRSIVLESADQGVRREFTQAGGILNVSDPSDPLALAKAALMLHGIVPRGTPPETPLSALLEPLGGGVHLKTQIGIPKGSGLGTSSILSGAILLALGRLVGRETAESKLFDYVLCAEQMLTTGGGWQDQAGGLTGGIKLMSSRPGLPQSLTIEPIDPAPGFTSEVGSRLVVVYTGVRRLAKNILRTVMGRYMARDPEAVSILGDIQDLARQMAESLARNDIDTLGRLMKLHWTLNKSLDPGSSNPAIDELYGLCEPYMVGGKLAGAGGGGVIELIAKSPEAARDLRRLIEDEYSVSGVAVWPCSIAERGYEIETE